MNQGDEGGENGSGGGFGTSFSALCNGNKTDVTHTCILNCLSRTSSDYSLMCLMPCSFACAQEAELGAL